MAFPTSYFDIRGNFSIVPSAWMMVTLFVSTENPLSAAVMSLATIKSKPFLLIFAELFSIIFSLSAANPTLTIFPDSFDEIAVSYTHLTLPTIYSV